MPPALLRSRAPRLPFLRPSASVRAVHLYNIITPMGHGRQRGAELRPGSRPEMEGLGYEIAGLCAAPPVALLSQRKRDRLDGKREKHLRTTGQAFSYFGTSRSMIGICKFQPCLRHSLFHRSSGTSCEFFDVLLPSSHSYFS